MPFAERCCALHSHSISFNLPQSNNSSLALSRVGVYVSQLLWRWWWWCGPFSPIVALLTQSKPITNRYKFARPQYSTTKPANVVFVEPSLEQLARQLQAELLFEVQEHIVDHSVEVALGSPVPILSCTRVVDRARPAVGNRLAEVRLVRGRESREARGDRSRELLGRERESCEVVACAYGDLLARRLHNVERRSNGIGHIPASENRS